jgi:hypothetical protein
LAEYRRGLSIDPYSVPGRRRYAELLRLSGLAAAYHAELAFLKDLGKADRAIDDALEIYGSLCRVVLRWTGGLTSFLYCPVHIHWRCTL